MPAWWPILLGSLSMVNGGEEIINKMLTIDHYNPRKKYDYIKTQSECQIWVFKVKVFNWLKIQTLVQFGTPYRIWLTKIENWFCLFRSVALWVSGSVWVLYTGCNFLPEFCHLAVKQCCKVFVRWSNKLLEAYMNINIARIANAVQVTICLLVSTSVY